MDTIETAYANDPRVRLNWDQCSFTVTDDDQREYAVVQYDGDRDYPDGRPVTTAQLDLLSKGEVR